MMHQSIILLSWTKIILQKPKSSWNFYQYMIIFLNLSLTSSHLYPVQVVNCDSNSRLVVDKDDNGKFRPERVNLHITENYSSPFHNPVSGRQCHRIYLTILRGFSWPRLAYVCRWPKPHSLHFSLFPALLIRVYVDLPLSTLILPEPLTS